MITISTERCMYAADGSPVYYREGECLSADTKPTTWANGSKLIEMDTSKLYLYDAANHQWREW